MPDCEQRTCFNEAVTFVEINGFIVYLCEQHAEEFELWLNRGDTSEIAMSKLTD